MSNSINTNLAAYYAQQNIAIASAATSLSIARLSSGNRIVRAADDVAGLAISTALQTGVSSLRTALTNASQGNSLLQVADGALSQLTTILQRMKSITGQASSGSLDPTARGFLNQEFQALTDEIDRIAANTNFNGVELINGALSGSTAIGTNNSLVATGSSANAGTDNVSGTIFTDNTDPLDGDTITVNGVTVTFTTSAQGTTGAVGKVSIGSDTTNTMANLAAFLNNSGDPHFANLFFTNTTNTLLVHYTGGTLGAALTVTATSSVTTGANFTAANGSISAQATALGLGVNRVTTSGVVTGSVLANGSTTAALAGGPFNFSTVKFNEALIGKFGTGGIGTFSGNYTAADTATLSIKIGDITYTTAATDITNAAAFTLTFTGHDGTGAAAGGTFTLNLAGGIPAALAGQEDVDAYVGKLNSALSDVTFFQNRDVSSFNPAGIVTVGGVQVANLSGLSIDARLSDFSSVNVSGVKITAPGVGETDARIEITVNGHVFRSISGGGASIGKTKIVALQNVDDPKETISIVTGTTSIASSSTVTLDLTSQDKADAVASALEAAFGLNSDLQGLSFQVGASSQDTLNVTIGDASSSALFAGAELDVLTQATAAVASDAVSTAISNLTSLRASVGALQSRFGFASAGIATAIQNQVAAASDISDTDIATESSNYATSQVKLQAGISVLAQANQQLQALLKLIG